MKDRSTAWDVLFALALAAIATAQLWPGLSAGLAPPISWDHGSHLGKAMLTWEMLPSLRGWSDLIETAVPINTVYTATGTILILLVRVFTQDLDWTQTYAISIVVFRTITALSVTVWAVGAGAIAWVGVGIAAALLAYEHSLVAADDLSKLDAAFFTMNGVISMAFFACVLADRLLA